MATALSDKPTRKMKVAIHAINNTNVFWPGIDVGVQRLDDRPLTPEILDHGVDLGMFFAQSAQGHRQHATNIFKRYNRFRSFSAGVAFPNTLVVATDVRISKTITTISDKFLFSGASGTRMLVKMTSTQKPAKQARFEQMVESFETQRAENDLNIPLAPDDTRDLHLVIMAKNLFNYYHFTLETLPSLALYRDYNLTGLIIIHTATKRQGDFVKDQILSFFPDFADRVALQFEDIRLAKALIVLDSKFLYFQSNDDTMPSVGELCHKSWLWRDRELDRQSLKTLTMNSYATPLRRLRDIVIERLNDTAVVQATLPKPRRLYVRRRPTGRIRAIVNEELLIAMLDELGFDTVYFEDYDVLEQARLMSTAEVVISVHGAGMTNMLYVPEGCLVVELSSLQITMLRFGDFNSFALVAKARYLHFLVDHDWPDQETIPDFKTNSIVGLKVNETAVAELRGRLLEHLEKEEFDILMDEARSFIEDDDMVALQDLVAEHADRLAHKADIHLWAATCAEANGDLDAAMDHLVRASRRAPMRQPIQERGLQMAKQLNRVPDFDEIASDYFCFSGTAAKEYFEAQGWDASAHI